MPKDLKSIAKQIYGYSVCVCALEFCLTLKQTLTLFIVLNTDCFNVLLIERYCDFRFKTAFDIFKQNRLYLIPVYNNLYKYGNVYKGQLERLITCSK